MKVRRIVATSIAIPFRQPLQTARGAIDACRSVLVQVESHCGRIGLGEITLPPAASAPMAGTVQHSLAQAAESLTDVEVAEAIEQLGIVPLPARVGLEVACYDVLGQSLGGPLAGLLGQPIRTRVPVNALIHASTPAATAAAARQAVADGFRCLKLKVGRDIGLEAARLAAVRDQIGPHMAIRIDANGAWTVAEAVAAIDRLGSYGLEYVEQPAPDLSALAEVRRAVAIPVAADESIEDANDVERAAQMDAADIVVLKPARLGIRGTLAAIHRATTCGLRVVLTSSLDTSVGIAAAAHLAALLPDPALPCGLATLPLLAGDLAKPSLVPSQGFLPLPPDPGLGVVLDSAAVRRWKTDA